LCYLILITRARDVTMVSPFQSDYSYVCGMTTNTQRQQEAVEVEVRPRILYVRRDLI
jgi:hypothetical protein